MIVTEEEVSLAISSGIVEPLRSGQLPPDFGKMLRSMLAAMGTSPEKALSDPDLREAYRRFLLVQRHAVTSGVPREERLAKARANAAIETFPEVLAGAR